MAFPADLLDVRAALYYNSTWNYITGDVRGITADSGGGVRVVRGRSDESGRVTPTRCDLVLESPAGEYNPRVPTSALYSLIGRNTPLQVSVGEPHVGAAGSDDSASTSHVAPSVTAASAGLLVSAWASSAALDYTSPVGMTEQVETDSTLHTLSTATESVSAGATGTRTATASASTDWVAASAVLHGSSITVEEVLSDRGSPEITTAAGTQAGWWLVAVNFWGWVTDTETQPDMTAVPLSSEGGWILLADSGEKISGSRTMRVKILARRVKHAGAQTESVPDMNVLSVHDNHLHLLVVSGVDDWGIRATVEIPSWPQRWDTSGNDGWVPVSGAGILRRLGGQGQQQLRSPIYRATTRTTFMPLVAYWPLEDGTDATVFESAINGHPAGVLRSAVDGSTSRDDTLPGSEPVPSSASTPGVRMPVHGYADNGRWRVEFLYKPPVVAGTVTIFSLRTTGTAAVWDIDLEASSVVRVRGISDTGTVLVNDAGIVTTDFFGDWVHVMLAVSQSGGTVSYKLKYRKVGTSSVFQTTGSFSGSTGRVSELDLILPDSAGGSDIETAAGHVTLWDDGDSASTQLHWVGDDGHVGETAGERVRRLCAEEGVALAFVGDRDDTPAMGVQPIDTLLNLLRQCETVDLGVLYEPREMLGLAYRTRASLYNQTALLALTYGADGEVVPPLHPEPDDLLTANDVTVTKVTKSSRGSAARAVQVSGPLAVETIGKYEGGADLNVVSDLDLANQALWRLNLGTVDEDRFPVVSVNLAALGNAGKTALLTSAQIVDVGDRLTIDTPPDFLPPDDIDQLVQGYREEFGQFEWRMELNCSPASPWRVLVWQAAGATPDPDAPARFDSGGSTVASSFVAGTGTSLSVAIATGHPLWTTDSGDLPFDILVHDPATSSGVRLRVTAISGTSSPQTFTVTQTPVNGAEKTIPAGDEVRLWASVPWAL